MTIRSKLIATNILVFGVILVAVAVVVYDRTRESEIAKVDSGLESYAAGFITELEDEWENNEFPESGEIEAFGSPHPADIRVQLIRKTGQVVFRRGDLPPLSGALLAQAFANGAAKQNVVVGRRPFRRLVQPVEMDEQVRFALVLATPVVDLEDRLDALSLILALTLGGALLLSSLAVYFLTGRAFQPITHMVEAAEMISASTLHRRLATSAARNEVSRLTDALNAMIDRIEGAFKSQRQFVADASHELRTPLTVIYSELEFLRREIEDDRSDSSMVEVMREIDRLAHLVDQLLILARLDARKLASQLGPVRLDELLADCVGLLQGHASERKVRIQLQIDDVLEAEADRHHLKRVFINVIDNAIKYSPENGEVAITLHRGRNEAVVTVDDQGAGLDPAEIEHVFRRFYRSPRARQAHDGSGLGLAIARELVEAQDGRISIANRSSGGASVTVTLTLHTREGAPPQ